MDKAELKAILEQELGLFWQDYISSNVACDELAEDFRDNVYSKHKLKGNILYFKVKGVSLFSDNLNDKINVSEYVYTQYKYEHKPAVYNYHAVYIIADLVVDICDYSVLSLKEYKKLVSKLNQGKIIAYKNDKIPD